MSTTTDKFQEALREHEAGRLAEAVRLYEEVVRSDPRHAQAWHQLGCIALAHGKVAMAEQALIRAIRLDGGQAPFHNNLGDCYRTMGRLADAEKCFRQAIKFRGDFAAPRANLCQTLYAQGRVAEAEGCAHDALQISCSSAEEHCVVAALRLLYGDFERGWAEHEWRLERPGAPRPKLPGARWDGRTLAGESVLLWGEQGHGDRFQFVRYVPMVSARGGRPVLWMPPSLLPLLAASGYENLASWEDPAPDCAYHAGLASLPHLFGTTLVTVPNQVPYLQADAELVRLWRERLAGIGGFRVGICWQGNPVYSRDVMRSLPLRAFAALAAVPGVRLVSLQKCDGLEQLAEVAGQFEVIQLGPDYDVESGAFMNAAAIVHHLDLVVTADTAMAHLAGALAVPVWVALPIVPDFRWMLERSDTPWYPTMRLFRQRRAGDWSEVFERMAAEAAVLAAGR
jgi:tetratricopeptide (TPR) repeat protein